MSRAAVCFLLLACSCVTAERAQQYASEAHPECSNHKVTAHTLSNRSQSEVSMVCRGVMTKISIKCKFGFGLISDTVCHENN